MWMMVNLQDYNSYLMMFMIEFHDLIMMILFLIMLFIFYIMIWYFFNKFINKNILHNQFIEIIWTIIPMFILMFMAIPSLKILYLMEEIINPFMTIKMLGHQWYWSYEYVDFFEIEFDSFMLDKLFNVENMFRLLDVDNHLVLPKCVDIRGLVSSMDVIHSWSMPSLGIKVDAIPGRVNQFILFLLRYGIYFGQCSEICGLNHSFMPIVLESVNFYLFFIFLMKNF
uniref:Cytochrome c oxidase subunit 2 n=1 Tax=Acanthormius sp. QL-2013 TaxID=1421592 RepID=A0A0A6ZKR9_9HYME|nr:cytochrome c oxidase subunit II [Acanthormius sp. QL-2013]